jgi:hypothetical protein
VQSRAKAAGGTMMFIHPMWADESQRLGKQKCTPTGYVLHVVAELIGLLGLVFLFVVPAVLVWNWFVGTFQPTLWWLFAWPFGVGIFSEVLFQYSWWLALKRGFRYDYKQSEASWVEAGERRRFKYSDDPASRRG